MLVRAAAVHSSETTYTYAVSRTDEVVGRGLESLRVNLGTQIRVRGCPME